MARVTLNDPHQVQFFVTCSLNQGHCDAARERVRERFLEFARNATDYMRQHDADTGEPINGPAPRLVDRGIQYAVECGEGKRRSHVHAIIQCEGRGRVSFDLERVREDFPNTYWNFQYVRKPKTAEETLAAMRGYATKAVSAPPRPLRTTETTVDELVTVQGARAVGTTSDVTRTRRKLEREGHRGSLLFCPLSSTSELDRVLEAHTCWTRRPKKTAKFIFLVCDE